MYPAAPSFLFFFIWLFPSALIAQKALKKPAATVKAPLTAMPAPASPGVLAEKIQPHIVGAAALVMMPPLNLAVSTPFSSAFGGAVTYQLDMGQLRPAWAGFYGKAIAGFIAATSHNEAYSGYTMVVPGMSAGYWLVLHRTQRWAWGPALEIGYWQYFSTFRYADPVTGASTVYRASRPTIPAEIRFTAELDGRFLFGLGADYFLFVERAPVHIWGVRVTFGVRL